MLVGRDGVRRWIGAETQVALSRYFGPHDDAQRLPIFPILLGDTSRIRSRPSSGCSKPRHGTGWIHCLQSLLEQIRDRAIVASEATSKAARSSASTPTARIRRSCSSAARRRPWTRSPASTPRRGSPTVRWLEINGNSGSGKSSLMNAGLLPLVDQGWLWPRTGFETGAGSGR